MGSSRYLYVNVHNSIILDSQMSTFSSDCLSVLSEIGRMAIVADRVMTPTKDVHVLIPGTCECSHGQTEFADVIKGRDGKILLDYLGSPI